MLVNFLVQRSGLLLSTCVISLLKDPNAAFHIQPTQSTYSQISEPHSYTHVPINGTAPGAICPVDGSCPVEWYMTVHMRHAQLNASENDAPILKIAFQMLDYAKHRNCAILRTHSRTTRNTTRSTVAMCAGRNLPPNTIGCVSALLCQSLSHL